MRLVSTRIVAGAGVVVALAGCGSPAQRSSEERATVSTSPLTGAPASSTTVSTTTSSTRTSSTTTSGVVTKSSTTTSSGATNSRHADIAVDGGSMSVSAGPDGLVVDAFDTLDGWTASVDDEQPDRLLVVFTAPGRRTEVDIVLTADGISTSSRSVAGP